MLESIDRADKEIMESVGPRILSQVSRQFENLQEAISLNPSNEEMTEALGKDATETEREAYRRGHQSGWFKGALMFGCTALAALSVLMLATSGETKKALGEGPLQDLPGRS